jgi:hypothetical protein
MIRPRIPKAAQARQHGREEQDGQDVKGARTPTMEKLEGKKDAQQ